MTASGERCSCLPQSTGCAALLKAADPQPRRLSSRRSRWPFSSRKWLIPRPNGSPRGFFHFVEKRQRQFGLSKFSERAEPSCPEVRHKLCSVISSLLISLPFGLWRNGVRQNDAVTEVWR